MQGLLGAISQLTVQQQQQQQQLLQQETCIAKLAAAIPTAAAVSASALGVLHCSISSLALLSGVLGGSSNSGDVLSLTLSLRNTGKLPGGWSVLLTHASSCGAEHVMLAAPLGALKSGAEWKQQCHVIFGARGSARHRAYNGHLRVVLCWHGSSAGGPGTQCCGLLLLHSVKVDALHLLQLGRGSSSVAQLPVRAAAQSPGAQASASIETASLLLQLPISLHNTLVAAEPLLQQLLAQGLSTQPNLGSQQEDWQAAAMPTGTFSLLLPPNQQFVAGGRGSGSATRSGSFPGSNRTPVSVSISAEVLNAAVRGGSGGSQLRVSAASADPAALLAMHCDVSQHARRLVQGAAQQEAQHWRPEQLASSTAAAAAAADEAVLVQLRELRAAAIQLKAAAQGERCWQPTASEGVWSYQEQASRRARQQELLGLVVAARLAVASLPVLCCTQLATN